MNHTQEHKSRTIALLLALFFGGVGIQNFYLGRTGVGITQLILLLAGWATSWIIIGALPLAIVGIWALVDCFLIIFLIKKTIILRGKIN